jgi:hypothetical protein
MKISTAQQVNSSPRAPLRNSGHAADLPRRLWPLGLLLASVGGLPGASVSPSSSCPTGVFGRLPHIREGFQPVGCGSYRKKRSKPLRPEGRKELIGFTDGARESAQDWRELPVETEGLDGVRRNPDRLH